MRYDVHPLIDGGPLVLDVQSDLLDGMATRVVVPLLRVGEAPLPAGRLNPVFDIDGTECVMATQMLAAVPLGELAAATTNLNEHSTHITTALDMLFHGF